MVRQPEVIFVGDENRKRGPYFLRNQLIYLLLEKVLVGIEPQIYRRGTSNNIAGGDFFRIASFKNAFRGFVSKSVKFFGDTKFSGLLPHYVSRGGGAIVYGLKAKRQLSIRDASPRGGERDSWSESLLERIVGSHSSALGCPSSLAGGDSLHSDFPISLIHCSPLSGSDASVNGSRGKGEPSSHRQPLLKAIVAIIAFLSLSFYCFWDLQFGSHDWRLLLVLLILCFFGIMYGAYNFFDAIAQQSQLRNEFIANRYEPLSDDVHKNEPAVTGLLLGWLIYAGPTNADEFLVRHVVPVSEWSAADLAEDIVVPDAANSPQISPWRAVEQFGSVLVCYHKLSRLCGHVVPEEPQWFSVRGYDGIIRHAPNLHKFGVVRIVRRILHLDVGVCRNHKAGSCSVVGDSISEVWFTPPCKVGIGLYPVNQQPSPLTAHNGLSIIASSLGRVLSGLGLNLYLSKISQPGPCGYASECSQDPVGIDWWPSTRFLLGVICLCWGSWLVYDYSDGATLTRKICSTAVFAIGWLLLLICDGW